MRVRWGSTITADKVFLTLVKGVFKNIISQLSERLINSIFLNSKLDTINSIIGKNAFRSTFLRFFFVQKRNLFSLQ
jgi:hypothetical protein